MSNNQLVPIDEKRSMNPTVWSMISDIALKTEMSASEQRMIAKKLLFCYENALPFGTALFGGLYVVNGRLEVEGNVIRGQLRKHPNYDYRIVELTNEIATIDILDGNGNLLGTTTFTMKDAEMAGLSKNPTYQKYPSDMLLNRATSRAYKRYAPDLFSNSVYVKGEINNGDVIEGELGMSMGELVALYGNEQVLFAMQQLNTDDVDLLYDYLQGSENNG